MDPWYVLFRDGADAKWASAPSRGQAIAAARRLLDDGVPVIEVGPLDPGSAGETVIGDALLELCSTFTP
jgi:hypothetical protein